MFIPSLKVLAIFLNNYSVQDQILPLQTNHSMSLADIGRVILVHGKIKIDAANCYHSNKSFQ